MTDRYFPNKRISNARVVRPVSARVFVWLATLAVAGSILSCGFVISARQHFEAVTLGYEKEAIRLQEIQLDEKLRRLDLEKARASSPVELERRAKEAGLGRPELQTAAIRRPASERR
ncbi:MAG TPA: hypothetical protein VN345_14305 [Blastocatellia bacterium]|jgi:hypothetical protein|nr:hypothetical protein [Blastocatellia bacterium]